MKIYFTAEDNNIDLSEDCHGYQPVRFVPLPTNVPSELHILQHPFFYYLDLILHSLPSPSHPPHPFFFLTYLPSFLPSILSSFLPSFLLFILPYLAYIFPNASYLSFHFLFFFLTHQTSFISSFLYTFSLSSLFFSL